jgi:sirohydrochlorin ferrochelatase
MNLANTDKIDAVLSLNLPVVSGLVLKYPTYMMHKLTRIRMMGRTVVLATSTLGATILSIRHANSSSAHTTTSRHTAWPSLAAWCTDTVTATPSVLSLVAATAAQAHVVVHP